VGMEANDMMKEGCGMKIMDEKYVFSESQDG
jgi:hypothetical protein